ncbi:MAG: DUF4160 domain-containing protein [Lachnospiraceae bacterium]|nr:DUF4160 domain-containing protein [Lachnospiraceae bacterium]
MPQIFRFGSYRIYFWTNESKPLEPIHVHISDGRPTENATKVWITRAGKCFLCHNKSKIPERILKNMMRMIEARSAEVIEKWYDYFGEVSYYC